MSQPGDRYALLIVEPVVRVHLVVAQKFISTAMEAVGARPRDQIDDGRAAKAVFRTEVRFLYLKLFDGIDRGRVGIHANAAILLIVRRRHAVHQDVSGGIPASIRDEVVGGAAHACRIHLGDSRREKCQIENSSIKKRQIIQQLPVHHLPGNRVFRA